MDTIEFVGRQILLRIVKPYHEARNHVYAGTVLGYDGHFLCVDCTVMTFGRATADDPAGGLTTSGRATRWVALQRIEFIRELPEGMDPFDPEKFKVHDGRIDLSAFDRPDLLPD